MNDDFLNWFNEQFPKEFVSMLDVNRFRAAEESIRIIHGVFEDLAADFDAEDKPVYSARFDKLMGTSLGFSVDITNLGISLVKSQIDKIYKSLPENVVIAVDPLTDEKMRISFTFYGVKKIIAAV